MDTTTRDAGRPQSFEEYVGQPDLKRLLRDIVDASKQHNTAMPHMLFHGEPGLGKTAVAEMLAAERRVPMHYTMGKHLTDVMLTDILCRLDGSGYSNQRQHGVGGRLLDRSLIRPPIFVIDEAEGVPSTSVWEELHNVMEPKSDGRRLFMAKVPGRSDRQEVWVPELTVILMTNYLGKLEKKAAAVLNRITIRWQIEPYTDEEITEAIRRYAVKQLVQLMPDAAAEIGRRSLGVPRTAVQLFTQAVLRRQAERMRGVCDGDAIDLNIVVQAADLLRIDHKGLGEDHRRFLRAVAKSPTGKMSLESIAVTLGVEPAAAKIVERQLIRQDMIAVVTGGRQITDAGLNHLGVGEASAILSRLA